MFELISLIVASVGSTLAGLWDLKTTEIPDEIPYVMMIIAIVLSGIQSYIEWSYLPLLYSLAVGLILLAFGFVMYYFGQWGGGDAKVLAAIGFFIPMLFQNSFFAILLPFPFSSMLTYLLNLFLIGTVYMILYAFVLAIMHKEIIFEFFREVKATSNFLIVGSLILFSFMFAINWYLTSTVQVSVNLRLVLVNSLITISLAIFLFFIWKFTKAVESIGFKKKIPLSKLRVGDVLLESKVWEGITEKELKAIRRSGKKSVIIKEGIRFAPTFVFALLFTYLIGDVFSLILRFLI